jgi:hypothetical protein
MHIESNLLSDIENIRQNEFMASNNVIMVDVLGAERMHFLDILEQIVQIHGDYDAIWLYDRINTDFDRFKAVATL